MTLWHVSDDPAIARFEPRMPATRTSGLCRPVVWAIDDAHLVNYLLPRDCPRVAVRCADPAVQTDAIAWLGQALSPVTVFIEAAWLGTCQRSTLWLYALPHDSFSLADANAGYWVSERSVVPSTVQMLRDPLAELARRGAELRVVSSLWPVARAVAGSALAFSIIRMRNAAPESDAPSSPTIAAP